MFAPNDQLRSLEGQISIIYAGSFFHLFDYDQQYEVALLVTKLLKPVPGSLLIGRQVGNVEPGVHARPGDKTRFRHSDRTWKEMWEKVGKETGTEWNVDARLQEWSSVRKGEKWLASEMAEDGTRRLFFVVKRV